MLLEFFIFIFQLRLRFKNDETRTKRLKNIADPLMYSRITRDVVYDVSYDRKLCDDDSARNIQLARLCTSVHQVHGARVTRLKINTFIRDRLPSVQ